MQSPFHSRTRLDTDSFLTDDIDSSSNAPRLQRTTHLRLTYLTTLVIECQCRKKNFLSIHVNILSTHLRIPSRSLGLIGSRHIRISEGSLSSLRDRFDSCLSRQDGIVSSPGPSCLRHHHCVTKYESMLFMRMFSSHATPWRSHCQIPRRDRRMSLQD